MTGYWIFCHFFARTKTLWLPVCFPAHHVSFEKGSTLKGKNLTGIKFFPLRVGLLAEGDKNNVDRIASPQCVAISLKWLYPVIVKLSCNITITNISVMMTCYLWYFKDFKPRSCLKNNKQLYCRGPKQPICSGSNDGLQPLTSSRLGKQFIVQFMHIINIFDHGTFVFPVQRIKSISSILNINSQKQIKIN